MKAISEQDYHEMEDSYMGFCTKCNEFTRDMTEPDAEDYYCPECGHHTVQGTMTALFCFSFLIKEAAPKMFSSNESLPIIEKTRFTCSRDIYRHVMPVLTALKAAYQELFCVIGLNNKNNILFDEVMFIGTPDGCLIHPGPYLSNLLPTIVYVLRSLTTTRAVMWSRVLRM